MTRNQQWSLALICRSVEAPSIPSHVLHYLRGLETYSPTDDWALLVRMFWDTLVSDPDLTIGTLKRIQQDAIDYLDAQP